jgi:hypothetical protein
MDLFLSIEWPYWLIIAGAGLIAIGFFGIASTRSKEKVENSDLPATTITQMPPLPRLLDSSSRSDKP